MKMIFKQHIKYHCSFWRVICCFIFVVFLYHPNVLAQRYSELKNLVRYHTAQEDWQKAEYFYQKLLEQKPNKVKYRYQYIQLLLNQNKPSVALSELEYLINTHKKWDPICYAFLGQGLQGMNMYAEASEAYKKYLKLTKPKDIDPIIDLKLRQAWVGIRYSYPQSVFFVENLGQKVNTQNDEVRPLFSPNYSQRLYFSSNGVDYATKTSDQNYQMLSCELNQGVWHNTGPMDEALAANKNQVLEAFSRQGQSVYFSEWSAQSKADFRVHHVEPEKPIDIMHQDKDLVFTPMDGDRDLWIFNDSMLLFSSNQRPGYGGFDLFMAYIKSGKWVVENLGPHINSPYDEITPYLTLNGRDLYFSSNGEMSMGEYDVLHATYNTMIQEWNTPENMGQGINSGKSELGFKLSKEGKTAVFVSNRPGGYGGYDIYGVYFKEALLNQQTRLTPELFFQVEAYQSFSEMMDIDEAGVISTLSMPELTYTDGGVVLTSVNQRSLQELIKYQTIYPHLNFVIRVHSNGSENSAYDLYSGLKIGKEIGQFLIEEGVDYRKFKIWSLGGQYPKKLKTESKQLGRTLGLNNRIDIQVAQKQFHNHTIPGGRTNIQRYSDDQLEKISDWGLHYRLRLTRMNQAMKGNVLDDLEDLMIESKLKDEYFSYYTGLYPTFAQAKAELFRMKSLGFSEVAITAFNQFNEIQRSDIDVSLLEKYPDLKNYLIYLD